MDSITQYDTNTIGLEVPGGRARFRLRPPKEHKLLALSISTEGGVQSIQCLRYASGFGLIIASFFCLTSFVNSAERRNKPIGVAEKRFREFDRNRDGKVSPAEFPLSTEFNLIDADQDGFISLEEARNYYAVTSSKLSELAISGDVTANRSSEISIQKQYRILKPAEHTVGRLVPDLVFRDIDGGEHRFSDFKSWAATVAVVTSTSCPLSKKFLPKLARIEKAYEKRVRFIFVNSTPTDSEEAIRTAIQMNDLKGPYTRDPDGALLASLGAMSTTDCFVIDRSLTLCYRGAVDDQYGIGYSLAQPRQSLLIDAIDAVLSGRTPRVAATDAPGCRLTTIQPATNLASKRGKVEFTYHNRISRIIQSNCVECHRDGGVAPFPLSRPADVESRSAMIAQVVKNGTMPPWFAATSSKGDKNIWENDRSLVEADKIDLLDWLRSDRPLGDPAEAPIPAVFANGWQIGEPDAVVQLPTPIAVSAEGFMPYQQIVVETHFEEDKWVRGFDIRPTAREVVHHVGVFVESGPWPQQKGLGRSKRVMKLKTVADTWPFMCRVTVGVYSRTGAPSHCPRGLDCGFKFTTLQMAQRQKTERNWDCTSRGDHRSTNCMLQVS